MGLFDALRERKAQRQVERADAAEVRALMFPPQADQVTMTGLVIDMRDGARYEGHNYVMTSAEQTGLMRGHLWMNHRDPTVGDNLRWTARLGDRLGIIVYTRPAPHLGEHTTEVAVRVTGRQEQGNA